MAVDRPMDETIGLNGAAMHPMTQLTVAQLTIFLRWLTSSSSDCENLSLCSNSLISFPQASRSRFLLHSPVLSSYPLLSIGIDITGSITRVFTTACITIERRARLLVTLTTFLEVAGVNLDLSFSINWEELRLETKERELPKFMLIEAAGRTLVL